MFVRGGAEKAQITAFRWNDEQTRWQPSNIEGTLFWRRDLGNSGHKKQVFALAQDRVAVVGGNDGVKIWVLLWNGSEWEYAHYLNGDGDLVGLNNVDFGHQSANEEYQLPKQVVPLSAAQFAVLAGARDVWLSVLRWNGGYYEFDDYVHNGTTKQFYDQDFDQNPQGVDPENYEPKMVLPSPGGDHFVVLSGRRRGTFSLFTWDGAVWSLDKHDNSTITNLYKVDICGECTGDATRVVIGNGYLAYVSGTNNKRVNAWEWTGSEWRVAQLLKPGTSTPVAFTHDWLVPGDPDPQTEVYGKRLFGGTDLLTVKGGEGNGRVWVLTWDGTNWRGHSDFYHTNFGTTGEKWHDAVGTYAVVRGGDNGKKAWFFYKFQDQLNKTIYTYTVDQKRLFDGFTPDPLQTTYSYNASSGTYDTHAGTAKFNKVTVSQAGVGRTETYFFNDDASSQESLNPDYYRLDGLSYKTESFAEGASSPITSATTDYTVHSSSEWPYDVFHKRSITSLSTKDGVSSSSASVFNVRKLDGAVPVDYWQDLAGTARASKSTNSDGSVLIRLAHTLAHEVNAYAAGVGPQGQHLLGIPVLNVTLENYPITDDQIMPDGWENSFSKDIVRGAAATTWSDQNNPNGIWAPCSSFAWAVPMDANGKPTADFNGFDFTDPASNIGGQWRFTGATRRYNRHGQVLEQESPGAGGSAIAAATVYRPDYALPLGAVKNARYDECALFTCDYDLDDPAHPNYFDYENGWEKDYADPYGCELSDESHFGEKSVYIDLPNGSGLFGPSRNVRLYPGRDYILSAWVKVEEGTLVMDGDYRHLVGDTKELPYQVSATQAGITGDPATADVAPQWQYLELSIPASTDLTNWENNVWCVRFFVGSPNGVKAYIDDIRFYPADALPTTTYYDSKWHVPLLGVDENNDVSNRMEYDERSRLVKWYKIKDIAYSAYAGSNVTLVQEKQYHLSFELPEGKVVQVNIPDGGQSYTVGQKANIHWVHSGTKNISFSYRKTDGSWSSPAAVGSGLEGGYHSYAWTVPADAVGTNCKVRVSDGTEADESDRVFAVVQ